MSPRKLSRRQNQNSAHAHTHVHANNNQNQTRNHSHSNHHPRNPSLSQIHQNAPQPSDYESEAYDSSFAPQLSNLSPPPPSRTTDELNLSVLQRHFPSVTSILSISSYTVVYIFNASTSSWEKSGIEGSLFVSQLQPEEYAEHRYSVVVLNRRGLGNFEAELREEGDVEVTEEFVILKTKPAQSQDQSTNGTDEAARDKIIGLWIFSEPAGSTSDTRALHGRLIKDCASAAGESRKIAEAAVQAQADTDWEIPNGHHSHQVSQMTEDSFVSGVSGPGPTETETKTAPPSQVNTFQEFFQRGGPGGEGYHSHNVSLDNNNTPTSWMQSNPFQQQRQQQYHTQFPPPPPPQQPPPQSRHGHYNEDMPYQPGEWHFRRHDSQSQQLTPQPEPLLQQQQQHAYQQQNFQQQQSQAQIDVLGDLFRRAGLGL